MNRHERVARPLSLLSFILLTACGPQVEEPEEEVRTFERRRPACETFCSVLQDPDCGSEEEIFASTQDCVEFCMSEHATYWALQEDERDDCAEEFGDYYGCAASSTCEERWIITNAPIRISETPCEDQRAGFLECRREHE
ncbi:MAG: hypothetical protein ACE37F_29780 [Nannocystaceae bacterium]